LPRCGSRAGTALAAAALACSVASPSTEVREALARAAPVEVAAGEGRIHLARAAFADVTVSLDGPRARVLTVVDADGGVRAGGRDVRFAYVGREALELERCPGRRWCPVGAPLPALAGVVEALVAAPGPGRVPVAWQIRVERDRATVGEDAELAGGGRAPRTIVELVREGGRWSVIR
jgi:hypothetical protein